MPELRLIQLVYRGWICSILDKEIQRMLFHQRSLFTAYSAGQNIVSKPSLIPCTTGWNGLRKQILKKRCEALKKKMKKGLSLLVFSFSQVSMNEEGDDAMGSTLMCLC